MISAQESEEIVCRLRGDDIDPPLLYPPHHQKTERRGSNLAIEVQRGGGCEVPDESNIFVSFMVC